MLPTSPVGSFRTTNQDTRQWPGYRRVAVLTFLLVGLLNPRPVAAVPKAEKPALAWVVRFALEYLLGHVLDYVADRTGLTDAVNRALDNLLGLRGRIPETAELAQIRAYLTQVQVVLQRQELTTAQLRQELTHLRLATDDRFRRVEDRVDHLLQLAIDQEKRLVALEARMDTRLLSLESRTDGLERWRQEIIRWQAVTDGRVGDVEEGTAANTAALDSVKRRQHEVDRLLERVSHFQLSLGAAPVLVQSNRDTELTTFRLAYLVTADWQPHASVGLWVDYLSITAKVVGTRPTLDSLPFDEGVLRLGLTLTSRNYGKLVILRAGVGAAYLLESKRWGFTVRPELGLNFAESLTFGSELVVGVSYSLVPDVPTRSALQTKDLLLGEAYLGPRVKLAPRRHG